MGRRLLLCTLAVSMGLALAALVLWLEAASPVQADGTVHCVNQTGTGCAANIACAPTSWPTRWA